MEVGAPSSPVCRPIDARRVAARVADGDRAGVGADDMFLHHVAQHRVQLRAVFGREHGDIGDVAQVGDVENAVMGGAVVTDQPGAIQAEDDGQVLDGDVVQRSCRRRAAGTCCRSP